MTTPRLGAKVRALRRRKGLTQVRLAERLGISASYLNLIEHNRRPLPAPLLIKLAQQFQLDLSEFAADDDARLQADLMEVLGDQLFDKHALANAEVSELVANHPAVARALITLYEAYRGAVEQSELLASRELPTDDAERVGRPQVASEEVTDLLQRHSNHFPDLELAAGALWQRAALDLDEMQRGLVRHLEDTLGVRVRFVHAGALARAVRRYDPDRRVLEISEVLPPRSRHFQLAHMVGLLEYGEVLDRLAAAEVWSAPDSEALARVALANHFAAAVLMPYDRFLLAARSFRYDIELLGHRFRVSFEQVCHRLTTLQRPGHAGVPFHFVRIDVAGNISKKFSNTGARLARYSGLCPRWNAFGAARYGGDIRVQLSRMPDGATYFSVARSIRKGEVGYHAARAVHVVELGCPVEHAHELVYADGVDLQNLDAAVPVGVTCRLCPRTDCEQRALPSIHQRLAIDENVRGLSFYAAPMADDE